MEVAIITGLFAERNMDVDAAHFLVFSLSLSQQNWKLRLRLQTIF